MLEIKGATLNLNDQTITYEGRHIDLSRNDFLILSVLVRNKGNTVSREKLMNALWQTDSFVDENTLSVNVNRLRKKLDSAGLKDLITTKFGIGYIIED